MQKRREILRMHKQRDDRKMMRQVRTMCVAHILTNLSLPFSHPLSLSLSLSCMHIAYSMSKNKDFKNRVIMLIIEKFDHRTRNIASEKTETS